MSFAKRVYEKTKEIPPGKVTTYKELAHALHTKAYRAVGNALRTNPDAPATTCHRVIKTDRTLGGYQGKTKNNKKQHLLAKEGITFDEDGRVAKKHLHTY